MLSCRLSCALNVDEFTANEEEDKLGTDSEIDRRFQDESVVIRFDHFLAFSMHCWLLLTYYKGVCLHGQFMLAHAIPCLTINRGLRDGITNHQLE